MRLFSFILLILIFIPGYVFSQGSQTYMQQGMIHYELEEYDAAISNFEQVLQFSNPPVEAYIYLTSAFLLQENPESALKTAEEGLSEFGENIRLNVLKGEALISQNSPEAITWFEEISDYLSQKPDNKEDGIDVNQIDDYLAKLHERKAAVLFQDGLQSEATVHYKASREYNPYNLSVHNNLAYILIQEEAWDNASEVIETGLEYFPESENLLFMKAQVLENEGKPDQMLDALQALYKMDESNMQRAVMYGKSLLNANRAQEANAFFWEKIEQYPDERILYRTLIEINQQRFNQSGILRVLELMLEQFPDDHQLKEEYGLELLRAGNYDEAHTYLDSLALQHDEPKFARLSGHALLYDDKFEEAEKFYQKNVEEWPSYHLLKKELGLLLLNNEKSVEAEEILEEYLSSNQDEWVQIKYANIINNNELQKNILHDLQETTYEGLANWLIQKNGEIENQEEDEVIREYGEILIGMIELYRLKQQTVQTEVQTSLNEFRTSNPPIFQVSTELEEISSHLHDLLLHVRDQFSFSTSRDLLEIGLNKFPESALLLRQRGILYYQNRSFENARNDLEQAVRLDEKSEESQLYLGHTYAELDKYTQAELSYERVLAIDEFHKNAYRSLVSVSRENGTLNPLCDRWMQRFKNNKNNETLREYLLEALHKAGRYDDAKSILSE